MSIFSLGFGLTQGSTAASLQDLQIITRPLSRKVFGISVAVTHQSMLQTNVA